METITDMPAGEVEQDKACHRPSKPRDEPLFSPDQQKAFDRAFSKREAKLRRESEGMRRDLLDTIGLTGQLLERCGDRISIEDERAIRSGLNAIRLEYVRSPANVR